MLGPANEPFNFPHNVWLVIAAFPLMGLFQTFIFIPIIPEMLERMIVDMNIVEGEDETIDGQLNDSVNDAYAVVFSTSMAVSPYIGSEFYSRVGPFHTAKYIGYFNMGFTLFIFLFNCGPFVFSENRVFEKKLYDLKAEAANDEQELTKQKT